VPGRRIEHDFGGTIILSGGISIWQIDPNHVIPQNLTTNTAANRFEPYFETDDIDREDSTLKESGVRCLHGVIEEPWGSGPFVSSTPTGISPGSANR